MNEKNPFENFYSGQVAKGEKEKGGIEPGVRAVDITVENIFNKYRENI